VSWSPCSRSLTEGELWPEFNRSYVGVGPDPTVGAREQCGSNADDFVVLVRDDQLPQLTRTRVLLYAGQPDWSKLATITP
jgi:hypothetical protein